jgi:hypothetical protein
MDEFGTDLRRISEFCGWKRVDAATASIARFQDRHLLAGACELARNQESRGSGADDDDPF